MLTAPLSGWFGAGDQLAGFALQAEDGSVAADSCVVVERAGAYVAECALRVTPSLPGVTAAELVRLFGCRDMRSGVGVYLVLYTWLECGY